MQLIFILYSFQVYSIVIYIFADCMSLSWRSSKSLLLVYSMYSNLYLLIPYSYLSLTLLSPLSVQFSRSVYPTLCNPMNCSTPGLPVHHQLPEFTQTRVHLVHDAIQPSHPLSSPSPPALNLSPMSQLFTSGGQNTGVSASTSILTMNTQD